VTIENFFYNHAVFTIEEFKQWKIAQGETGEEAFRKALKYYVKTGRLLRIRRKLYAVVPAGMPVAGFQPDSYLIAAKATEDSVLAYHTALALHGVEHSLSGHRIFLTCLKSQAFEEGNLWYRPVSPPSVLGDQALSFGVETIERQGVSIKVTSSFRTFVDVIDRIALSGGLEEVCRSLEKLMVLNIDSVVKYCLMLKNARLAAKVGYFLMQRDVGFAPTEEQIAPLLQAKPKSPQYLSTTMRKNCRLVKKWNLVMPEVLLERRWEEFNEY